MAAEVKVMFFGAPGTAKVNDLSNADGGMVNPPVEKQFDFVAGVAYRDLITDEPR